MLERYEFHDAADIFPLMEDAELQALADDIEQHGQQEPCIIWEDRVIDGRNRYLACQRLGIEPTLMELPECPDPITYVVSANLHRRHLSPTQRAFVGDRIRDHYAKQAKERQRQHASTAPGRTKTLVENFPPVFPEKARDAAGKAVGVSGKSVDMARKVRENGIPELAEAAEQDHISVSRAAQIADLPPGDQMAAISERTKGQPAKKQKPAPKPKAKKKAITRNAIVLPERANEGQVADVERWLELQDERPLFERFIILWEISDHETQVDIHDFVLAHSLDLNRDPV